MSVESSVEAKPKAHDTGNLFYMRIIKMREIKFRQFDKCINQFVFFELVDAEIVITNDKVVSFDDDRTDSPTEQFTGFKDSKGQDVYEGDIIEKDDDKFVKAGIVSFIHGCWMVASEDKERYFNLHWYLSQAEVVGNIHQNPELLEQNDDQKTKLDDKRCGEH